MGAVWAPRYVNMSYTSNLSRSRVTPLAFLLSARCKPQCLTLAYLSRRRAILFTRCFLLKIVQLSSGFRKIDFLPSLSSFSEEFFFFLFVVNFTNLLLRRLMRLSFWSFSFLLYSSRIEKCFKLSLIDILVRLL